MFSQSEQIILCFRTATEKAMALPAFFFHIDHRTVNPSFHTIYGDDAGADTPIRACFLYSYVIH